MEEGDDEWAEQRARTFMNKHEQLLDEGYEHDEQHHPLGMGDGYFHVYQRPDGDPKILVRTSGETDWKLADLDAGGMHCSRPLHQLRAASPDHSF